MTGSGDHYGHLMWMCDHGQPWALACQHCDERTLGDWLAGLGPHGYGHSNSEMALPVRRCPWAGRALAALAVLALAVAVAVALAVGAGAGTGAGPTTTAPTTTAVPTTTTVAPVPTTAPPCAEDDPCWDCATMGNRVCGGGALLPARYVERAPTALAPVAGRPGVTG